MYNSNFKYYIKGLLGWKNDMWYFDKLSKSFPERSIRFTSNTLSWAESLIEEKKLNEHLGNGFQINPIYEISEDLRKQSLKKYYSYYPPEEYKVFIHLPPVSLSVGGHSWLINFGAALEYMGLEVEYFWDKCEFISTKKNNVLLSIGSQHISSNLDWNELRKIKNKIKLKIGLQCSTDILSRESLHSYFENYSDSCIDFFYSFNSEDFIKSNTFFYDIASKFGYRIISLEFSANPLFHYAPKYLKQDGDFIFLGSSNYDKSKRYHDYFLKIFKKYKGIVAGPGWEWISDYQLSCERDRLLYSRSRIGLNLHLDFQIAYPRELNERTYILAAIGIPQLVDNAKLIHQYFTQIGFVSNDPEEYFHNAELILNDPSISRPFVVQSMKDIYDQHTTFHRVEKFLATLF